MNRLSTLSMMATFIALSVVFTGCSRANNQLGAGTNQTRSGTAMVRETGDDMPTVMNQYDQMIMKHLGEADQNYDLRFMDMMSRHHEGAILMAQDALKKAKHPEIKRFAQKVINDQQKEMKQLQAWRQEWYGSTASQ
jgi:uncharacterized protein (DUF305 family)